MQENIKTPEVTEETKAAYQKPTLEACGNWEDLTAQFLPVTP